MLERDDPDGIRRTIDLFELLHNPAHIGAVPGTAAEGSVILIEDQIVVLKCRSKEYHTCQNYRHDASNPTAPEAGEESIQCQCCDNKGRNIGGPGAVQRRVLARERQRKDGWH